MLPPPGVHVAACGSGVVEVDACCVTSQVTSLGVLSFCWPAMNCCDSRVGTLAVDGVTVMRIPESMPIFAVPVFVLSALEVAVRVLGKVEGAVNTTVVAVELAGMLPV